MFYWKYATKSLKRGGQRMVIALLCIAFGVMSLTSMQSLASTFKSLILIDPRLSVGGDAQVTHSETNFLSEQDLAEIEALHQSGEIKDYVPVSFNYNQILRLEGSSHAFFVNHAIGVDPTRYPLIGKIGLQDGRTLAQTLQGEGDAAITRDLATQLDIQVGDHLIMGGENSSIPISLTVQGIVDSTPDYQGQTVFFNLATAQALWGRASAITDVLVEWGNPSGEATLTQNGWSIYTPALQEASNKKAADVFNFMLNGAGILGL
ncbi:MAG: ABC transporter permease, partial [Chloroflexi bacterium]|nr:ABC transporter permease [Chloroflexota bacterium]